MSAFDDAAHRYPAEKCSRSRPRVRTAVARPQVLQPDTEPRSVKALAGALSDQTWSMVGWQPVVRKQRHDHRRLLSPPDRTHIPAPHPTQEAAAISS
jgi:hypothetical protein